jgi:hypothetical protein
LCHMGIKSNAVDEMIEQGVTFLRSRPSFLDD